MDVIRLHILKDRNSIAVMCIRLLKVMFCQLNDLTQHYFHSFQLHMWYAAMIFFPVFHTKIMNSATAIASQTIPLKYSQCNTNKNSSFI